MFLNSVFYYLLQKISQFMFSNRLKLINLNTQEISQMLKFRNFESLKESAFKT